MSELKNNNSGFFYTALGAVFLSTTMLPSTSSATLSWEVGDGVRVDFTNTLRYSAAARVKERDSELLANPNLDDGNQNFSTGLISNRFELYTELDLISDQGYGARVSAQGLHDRVYNRDNDNPGFPKAFPNHTSQDFDEFTDDTRDQHGRYLEMRDAFVFGRLQLGDTQLSGRLGQHSLVWGESLFFANNAIAGAQSPFDIPRLIGDPTAEAKEFVLPVPQVSAQWELTDTLSLGAYYQFRHRENRIPGVGSYFSYSDIVGEGAERLLLGPGLSAVRESDMDPDDSGQFGLQLRWQLGETDLGLYALRFHDKDLQVVTKLGFDPAIGGVRPTSYYRTYHEDTTLYGISASRSLGDFNFAAEASIRKDQSLASSHAVDASALGGAVTDNNDHPAYAVGDTAHINVSTIWSVPGTPLWNEANLVAEVAWTRLLHCEKNCDATPGGPAALDPNATRDSWSMRGVFKPTYRQVVSGLDISVPIGVGYTPKGSRNILGPWAVPAEDGGDFTIGLTGLYMNEFELGLAYTHFFGSTGELLDEGMSYSYQQARKDRDFVAVTAKYSF